MTDSEKVLQDEAVPSSAPLYNDAEIAAREAAEKQARIKEDAAREADPNAILEVRHLRKAFPIKKSMTGKVLQELVAVDELVSWLEEKIDF